MLIGILVFSFSLTLAAILTSYFYYKSESKAYYKDLGRMTLHTAVAELNADEALAYRLSGVEDERYLAVCNQLLQIRNAHEGVRRLYMMHFTPAGGVYIYDADDSSDRNPLGTREPVKDFAKLRGAALAGETIRPRIFKEGNESFLTMYQPVRTHGGKLAGYMIADIPMHQILEDQEDFVRAVSIPLLVITLLWAVLFFMWLYVRILSPLRALEAAIRNGPLSATDDEKGIHGDDEIEGLFHLIQKRERVVSGLSRATWKREHDALTELYNKEKYEACVGSDYQHLSSVGVVYVDVNDLRALNDAYGLPVGDIVLKKAARHVDRFLEGRGQGFRIGDDDFLMVFPGISEDAFIDVVQLIKDSSPVLNRSGDSVHCSLAVGYAYSEGLVDWADVFARAESSMRTEKKRMKEA